MVYKIWNNNNRNCSVIKYIFISIKMLNIKIFDVI